MSRRQIVTAFMCLCVLLVGIVACDSREEPPGNLYFVQAGPPDDIPVRGPHSVIVYKLDEESGLLSAMARTPADEWVNGVKCYTNMKRLIVSTRESELDDRIDKLYLFGADEADKFDVMELESSQTYKDFRLTETSMAGDIVRVYYRETAERTEAYMNSKTGARVEEKSLSGTEVPILAGLKPSYYAHSSDIVKIRLDENGNPISYRENYDLRLSAVPDSVVAMKESVSWNLIAAEPGYYVLSSVPHKNGLTQRELLVYNGDHAQWNSLLIEGNETRVRTVNGWLVGEVAQSDPATDWVRRAGYPPILSGEFALVNPMTLESYKVRAGDRAEFLWIDDSMDVYYRVGDELYRAKLENGDFVDKGLILKDGTVWMIHWAFRGPGAE